MASTPPAPNRRKFADRDELDGGFCIVSATTPDSTISARRQTCVFPPVRPLCKMGKGGGRPPDITEKRSQRGEAGVGTMAMATAAMASTPRFTLTKRRETHN